MNIFYLILLLIFQFAFDFDHALKFQQPHPLVDSVKKQKSDQAETANIVFKSTDGGQTWQDIGEGLPKPAQDEHSFGNHAFVPFAFCKIPPW